MANIERPLSHPNLLLVTGDDLYPPGANDPNTAVRSTLYAQDSTTSPVHKGTHDFWMVYGTEDIGAPNHGSEDASATPRPLRGAVVAQRPPTDQSAATVTAQVRTLLEEAGHHWLAYPNIKFHWRGRDVTYEQNDWDKLNRDLPFQGPAMAGRQLQHWGTFFHSGGSPMGGLNWSTTSRDGHLDRWKWEPLTGPTITPAGLPAITLPKTYCDLDLLAMGVKTPAECYPETGGEFRWVQPQYVVQPRHVPAQPQFDTQYLAGVFVAYSRQDFIYFGFDCDHRKLGIYRTNGTRYAEPIDLGTAFQPAWLHNSGVALRVVRSGSKLIFQARFDDSAAGLRVSFPDQNLFVGAAPDSIPGLFDGISIVPGIPASGSDFTTFTTVGIVDEPADPVAIGLIVKTGMPLLVDSIFCNIETKSLGSGKLQLAGHRIPAGLVPAHRPPSPGGSAPGGSAPGVPSPAAPARVGSRAVHHLAPLPIRWPTGRPFEALPADTPVLDLPVGDLPVPQAQQWNSRLRLQPVYDLDQPAGDPGAPPYDHTVASDRAPKVLLRAPQGNFAFGTSVSIRRTGYSRSSGGGPYGTELWGHAETLHASDVTITDTPDQPDATGKRRPPLDNSYRTAFIIAARKRSDITDAMLDAVDAVRRYWDPAFGACTDGRRRSSSTL